MSESTATPAPEKRPNKGSGYLPVLPTDWAYRVLIVGEHGQVTISADQVEVDSDAGGARRLGTESLAEGLKIGVEAVKAMDRLAETEAAYRQARASALDALGVAVTGDSAEAEEAPAGDLVREPDADADPERPWTGR